MTIKIIEPVFAQNQSLPRPNTVPGFENFKFSDSAPGEIISALLPYLFVIGGILLLLYLIWGGFELLTSTGNPEKIKEGQKKIMTAIVGFLIIFASYWLAQILEAILGLKIL